MSVKEGRPQKTSKQKKEEFFEISKDEQVKKDKDIIRKILGKELKLKAKNDSQIDLIRLIKSNEVNFVSGKAGCGKTFITLAEALDLLYSPNNQYHKIYLTKSVIVLKDEEMGFMPGDMKEKLTPHMMSFYITLDKLIGESKTNALMDARIINMQPLAYIRGTTLDNCIIILDETQNVTLKNLRTLLTRIGENSKIICLGDENQIDLKNINDSSLQTAMKIFANNDKFGVLTMDKGINVRNPIIDDIEDIFNNHYLKPEKSAKQLLNE
jgi:phosphate starvation-inducible PhoH-like protein